MQPLVFDKGGFCSQVDDGTYCRPLHNVGRDFGTFVYFAARYYHHLPDVVYFVAGNLKKHDRRRRVAALLRHGGGGKEPRDAFPKLWPTMHPDPAFTITTWDGQALRKATLSPLGPWAREYFLDYDENELYACFNGLLRSSRKRMHRRPRETFLRLLDAMDEADELEAVHFLERLAAWPFSPALGGIQ